MLQALDHYDATDPVVLAQAGIAIGVAGSRGSPQYRSAGGRFILAADIRIDNRAELANSLRDPLPNSSDSDLLLLAWDKWGIAALDRIAGDYAFALFDTRRRAFFLARDPTGQRPLYFRAKNESLIFASIASGILACPFVKTDLNFHTIALAASGRQIDPTESYFTDIERVAAGQYIEWSPFQFHKRWHWFPPSEATRRTDDQLVEEYRSLLDTSVEAAIDRPVGGLAVQLSGGWDSSAIAATAGRLTPADLRPLAFTAAPKVGFSGSSLKFRMADETALARLVARRHQLPHVVVRPDRPILDGLRDLVRVYQEPNANWANMVWIENINRQARDRGVGTLLSAQMGNLTLNAGGLPALTQLIRDLEWHCWLAESRSAVRSHKANWRGVLYSTFSHYLPAWLQGLLEQRFRGAAGFEESNFVRREWLYGHASREPRFGSHKRYSDRLDLVRRNDVGNFAKATLGRFGIDERDPMADRRLLDFSFTLRPANFLHDGEWRPLARRALADRVPAAILNNEQRGYQGADWYEHISPIAVRELLEEISDSPAVRAFLDIPKLERAIERWPTTDWNNLRTITIYRTRLPIALATGLFIQEFGSSAGYRTI